MGLAILSFPEMVERRQSIMQKRPHWYLEMLATRLGCHGYGAGSLLLEEGLRRADEMSMESYLYSSVAGGRLYEKGGFQGVVVTWFDHGDDHGEGMCVETRMLRPRGKYKVQDQRVKAEKLDFRRIERQSLLVLGGIVSRS